MAENVVGDVFDPAPDVLGTGQACGSPTGHLLDHVAPTPGGRRSAQLGQALGNHLIDVHHLDVDSLLGGKALIDHLGEPVLGSEAGVGGVVEPAVVQTFVDDLGMRLGRSGLQRRPLVGPPALLGGEAATEDGFGLGDAGPGHFLQGPVALGVVAEKPLGNADDVSLAVAVHRSPHHAQAGLALGPQGGVVDRAPGLELSVQGPRVERPPRSVLAAHPSGDQDQERPSSPGRPRPAHGGDPADVAGDAEPGTPLGRHRLPRQRPRLHAA